MKQRLDQELVARGLVQSRARAADLVRRGAVMVDGRGAVKPGQLVDAGTELAVDERANAYVARSGGKLEAALRGFGFDARNRVALDIGASTGGFTQVLLEAGARKVYAVDVGHDQLHASLGVDARVVSLEGQDARLLTRAVIAEPVEVLVADVSFVSLVQVLPQPLLLAAPGCRLVALVKPQFEVGPQGLAKGGIVRDESLFAGVRERILAAAENAGLRALNWFESPIAGGDGNREFFLHAALAGRPNAEKAHP